MGNKTIRGIRGGIPGGYLLGRIGSGRGRATLIPFTSNSAGGVQSQSTGKNLPVTLTGDVTGTGTTSIPTTLASTGVTAGSYGLASSVAQFVVDVKGRITSAVNVAISIASTAINDATAAGRAMLTAVDAAAQTALLNAMVGDTGTGGLKGLAPAPAAGDAQLYLRGDGTYAAAARRDAISQVANGDFEHGSKNFLLGTGWTINNDAANAYTGNYVAVNTDVGGISRVLTSDYSSACVPGDVIYAEVMVKTDVSFVGTVFRVLVFFYDDTGTIISSSNGTNYNTVQTTYVKSSVTATAPANTASFKARVAVTKTAGIVYADNLFAFRKRDAATLLKDNTVTNAQLAAMASNTFKGIDGGGPASPVDLTATQATAILNAMVGDSGSGGTKGLAPAPAAGDAAAGKFLKASGAWVVPATSFSGNTGGFSFVIDGGGAVLTAGSKGYIEFPFGCTLTQVDLIADQSGSVVVDLWKTTYASFDAGATHPVVGDSITAASTPTLSGSYKETDNVLGGWTKTISAGDIIDFHVTGTPATITRVAVMLKYTYA